MPEGTVLPNPTLTTVVPTTAATAEAAPRLLLAAGFSVASLAVHLTITFAFWRLGVYYFNDVLFASDTHNFLESIAHGERSVRTIVPDLRNSVHPFVWLYFSPLVRLVAKMAVVTHLSDANVFDLRMAVGVFVMPMVAAVQAFAFAALLFALGFGVSAVAALSLINLFCFSSMIFGSVPDHFAITNLALTLTLLFAVVVKVRPTFDRRWLWISLGLFAAGVTITDLVFFGIIHFGTRMRVGFRSISRAALRSAILTLALLGFVLTTASIVGDMLDGAPDIAVMRKDFVTRYLQDNTPFGQRIERAVKAVEDGFVTRPDEIHEKPAAELPIEYYPVTPPPSGERRVYPSYTLEARPIIHSVLGVVAVLMVLAGAGVMVARGGNSRLIALISIALILFNLVFHNIWGDEYLLYSQHWMTPVLLLLAGLFYVPTKWRGSTTAVVTLLAIAIGIVNTTTLWDLMDRLRTASNGILG